MSRFPAVDGTHLYGVSETTLWTLRNRAVEARRSDGALRDPWAITLFDTIAYDWDRFGRADQSHALRARAYDACARDYLTRHPTASVVALAEGLQTSFWRLDRDGLLDGARWYSIDLPAVTALRSELLPADDRISTLTQSALDPSWMDRIDTPDVFITAEGLLMYLHPDDALGLIRDCARRFPGGAMMFDSIPHWFSRRTRRGLQLSPGYRTPPMPFALTPDEALGLAGRIPGVAAAADVRLPAGRGAFRMFGSPMADRGLLRRIRPSITLLRFADDGGHR